MFSSPSLGHPRACGLVWSMLDAWGARTLLESKRPTIFLEGEVHRQNAVANFADGGK